MATVYFFNGTQSGTADGSYADPYDLTQLATQEGSATSGDIFVFKDGTYSLSTALSFGSSITSKSLTYRAESTRGVTFSSTSTYDFGNTNLTAGQTYEGLIFNTSNTGNDLITWDQDSGTSTKLHTFNDCDFKAKKFAENNGLNTNALASFNVCIFEQTGAVTSYWFEQRNGASTTDLLFVNCLIHNRTGTGTSTKVLRRCNVTLKNTIIYDFSNTITTSFITEGTETLSGPCDILRADGTTLSSDSNNIAQDPQFVDSANGDFRLRPSSPCIGAGTAN